MRKLTNNQIDFISEFFENYNHTNWLTIARLLIENSTCIVAGDECIWRGGIGNFIKVSNAENCVGCLLYHFDLESFLSSGLYKEGSEARLETVLAEKDEIEKLYNELLQIKVK